MKTPFKHALIQFFMYPASTFEAGFAFNDIFEWDKEILEGKHDYIQWYFPLAVKSQHHPNAPILNYEQLIYLRGKEGVRYAPNMQAQAFKEMLKFYRFDTFLGFISPTVKWTKRIPMWVNPGHMDHNYLRITRILTSLVLLKNEKWAERFYDAILTANEDFELKTGHLGIIPDVLEYWRAAVEDTNVENILTTLRLSPNAQS